MQGRAGLQRQGDIMVELAGIKLNNPVLVASGTFGYGKEYADFFDLNKLGGIITKSVTLMAKEGNPPPRIVETPSGMINSIGLQNEGLEAFLKTALPFLAKLEIPAIVNIAGDTVDEYAELAKQLSKEKTVKGIEVNISCPNVKKGGMAFGIDPATTKEVIGAVRKATTLPVIAKLSPNVTDITLTAKAAESSGANAISLINTVVAMAIDIETRRSRIGRKTGGLSGPAIRPIAVRMVHEASRAVKIPIIGIGGIVTGSDAIEFFLAGASAVEVGTANFVDTAAPLRILAEINAYLAKHEISDYDELIGAFKE
ncbi:dihydroorotate dehydrogenase B catalytic subunit [candidate division WOR-1 bacterium RIFOXYA12_FULL_52_29]|uniref:Dihydroorotate dehydrogenase n=1 Tax=candidate division WOR-1 bacterium RIFOXYC12_FULL_54_18 TaxID=1802584 RepID=A0A1F4T5N4_UNCSA|nr:MAG: dihydroorotate dehydrogenase B catalytic subunit [candidate division WOR-1 bacterium RIFOXYA2_FULL_51_19]OGC17655.1 MAG: dihydroorotate dehydrogenase B catalytic subunit [candidate division WOR-1 bacterium RIFOXYA12_FULL_52_29]OGC26512.1 MAG: dihydroorotate dehydrogenase B catalytic subunit [candidate division WOR-1 bacterium RIFOXYB2_FULL_45_9]OGC28072.1 MAG: dihydroorotate dehydrogenase B catalytic subunit [candidate division WOR-1 bacterium RIFOXYC12_FULL_54_18]OGC29642.1 MAG: dihydr